MKTVRELSEDEMNELKESYLNDSSMCGISYLELIESHNIPNEVIYEHYADVTFSDDDFFCNQD